MMDLSNIPKKYHSYSDQKDSSETDEEWMQRIDHLLDPGERGSDVYKCCYSTTDNPFLIGLANFNQDDLDALVLETSMTHSTRDESVLPVYQAVADVLYTLNVVPRQHSIRHDDADFYWAKARCIFAGAGHQNWKVLSETLNNNWPLCPFDPEEDDIAWEEANLKAHKICGWPVTVGWLDWHTLTRLDRRSEDWFPPKWLATVCLFQVLKTVRFNPETNTVSLYGNGTVQQIVVDTNTTRFADTKRLLTALYSHLNHRKGTKDEGYYPTAKAIENTIEHLNAKVLMQIKPRSDIGSQYLWGPWTRIVSNVANYDCFAGHGLALDGAWLAENGVVKQWHGTGEDVMQFDWPLGRTGEVTREQRRFAAIIPTQYGTSWAFDKFFATFPNISTTFFADHDAAAAIFDAPLVASLLRQHIPELDAEYPYIIFQPSHPSPGEDTNQGKSTVSLAYTRCMVSGMAHELHVPSSANGPNSRAVAAHLSEFGTACFGEFVVPSTPEHILCQNNMQTLATGSGISQGKAYSNEASTLTIAHSVVINSKNCKFRDDMVNRSLFFWLDALSTSARQNQVAYVEATCGKLSLDCKLGLVAVIESIGRENFISEVRKRMTGTTVLGMRFPAHKAIAQFIYELRGGKTAGAIDNEIIKQSAMQDRHGEIAALSGVEQDQQSDAKFDLRTSVLFNYLDEEEIQDLAIDTELKPVTAKQLFESYMSVRGFGTKELPDLLQELTGKRQSKTTLMVAQALIRDIRRRLPATDTETILPGIHGLNGWVLRRHTDRSNQLRVAIANTKQEAAENAGSQTSQASLGQCAEDTSDK